MSARACQDCGRDRVEVQRDDTAGPCPDCGEPLGARYSGRDGKRVCWSCLGLGPLPADPAPQGPEWMQFRTRIIDGLWQLDRDRFVYLDKDRVLGACPVCAAALPEYLVVRFHGETPRADIRCSLGCDERTVLRALRPKKAKR